MFCLFWIKASAKQLNLMYFMFCWLLFDFFRAGGNIRFTLSVFIWNPPSFSLTKPRSVRRLSLCVCCSSAEAKWHEADGWWGSFRSRASGISSDRRQPHQHELWTLYSPLLCGFEWKMQTITTSATMALLSLSLLSIPCIPPTFLSSLNLKRLK